MSKGKLFLTAEKNLTALKTIMTSLPSTTRLAFVGDGPERSALQQHYADMPNVKFMVSIDRTLGLTQYKDIPIAFRKLLSPVAWQHMVVLRLSVFSFGAAARGMYLLYLLPDTEVAIFQQFCRTAPRQNQTVLT